MVDQSIIGYFLQAGWIVKSVMLILLSVSVTSWAIIFQRRGQLSSAITEQENFEERFWSGQSLPKLYAELDEDEENLSGGAKIFYAGYKEYSRLRENTGLPKSELMDAIYRTMRLTKQLEIEKLSEHLNFLATTGSVSPYVGLFGTVCGIMTVLQAMGNVQQATISMVAPGVSEALIATALALLAAIPAMVAYNRFVTKIDQVENAYGAFAEEFLALIRRQHA